MLTTKTLSQLSEKVISTSYQLNAITYINGITIAIAAYALPFIVGICLCTFFYTEVQTFEAKQTAAIIGLLLNLASVLPVAYCAFKKSLTGAVAIGILVGLGSGILA